MHMTGRTHQLMHVSSALMGIDFQPVEDTKKTKLMTRKMNKRYNKGHPA